MWLKRALTNILAALRQPHRSILNLWRVVCCRSCCCSTLAFRICTKESVLLSCKSFRKLHACSHTSTYIYLNHIIVCTSIARIYILLYMFVAFQALRIGAVRWGALSTAERHSNRCEWAKRATKSGTQCCCWGCAFRCIRWCNYCWQHAQLALLLLLFSANVGAQQLLFVFVGCC